jgi:hypothetical protein
VGNTEYWAIVNRANNDDSGAEASAVAYDSEACPQLAAASATNNNILHIPCYYDRAWLNNMTLVYRFENESFLGEQRKHGRGERRQAGQKEAGQIE